MRLAALPLAFALLAATPAAAQIVINGSHQASASQIERGVPMQRQGWSEELRQTDRDVRHARERGEIGRPEARAIRGRIAAVQGLGAFYARDGLSEAELGWLDAQAFALRDLAHAPNRPVRRSRR